MKQINNEVNPIITEENESQWFRLLKNWKTRTKPNRALRQRNILWVSSSLNFGGTASRLKSFIGRDTCNLLYGFFRF